MHGTSLFYFNPTWIAGGNTQPPSEWPNNWFLQDLNGQNYICESDIENYCSQFDVRSMGLVSDLDERIATDSLENDPYTEESKWIMGRELYYKLYQYPNLRDSLLILDDFFNEVHSTVKAQLRILDADASSIHGLDSMYINTIDLNMDLIEGNLILIEQVQEALADTVSLTIQDQWTLLADLMGYMSAVTELTEINSGILQTITNSRALGSDDLKNYNASLSNTGLMEENERLVNDIFLSTIAKDIDEFTPEQEVDLLTVAEQCPALGGNVVFKARSMYSLINDEVEFDDVEICIQHGIVVKRFNEATPNTVNVIPNPAIDEAVLVISIMQELSGTFVIYDITGAEVFRRTVPGGLQHHPFSTVGLAPGIYHYKVVVSDQEIGVGKVTIVR